MTKITIERSWKKQESARVRHLENLRTIKYLERKLTNRLYLRHTSKKAHLIVKVTTLSDIELYGVGIAGKRRKMYINTINGVTNMELREINKNGFIWKNIH